MVSVGTFLSLGIIGAVGVGIYAVYRNADKIGGALATGIEESIVNPFGNWVDSLWFTPSNGSQTSTTPGQTQTVTQPTVPGQPTLPGSTTPKPTPGISETITDVLTGIFGPIVGGLPTAFGEEDKPMSPGGGTTKPIATGGSKPQEGYYYVNYEGSKYDTQWYLTAGQAAAHIKTAAAPGDSLLGLKFLGKQKLNAQAFQVFGKSQNYL